MCTSDSVYQFLSTNLTIFNRLCSFYFDLGKMKSKLLLNSYSLSKQYIKVLFIVLNPTVWTVKTVKSGHNWDHLETSDSFTDFSKSSKDFVNYDRLIRTVKSIYDICDWRKPITAFYRCMLSINKKFLMK